MCVCVHVHACVYKETHENKRLSAQQRTNMARVLKAHYLPHLGQKAPKDLIFLTIIIGGNFFLIFFKILFYCPHQTLLLNAWWDCSIGRLSNLTKLSKCKWWAQKSDNMTSKLTCLASSHTASIFAGMLQRCFRISKVLAL